MNISRLVLRSLTYYWRTNAAVVAGVATAVAVLSGALLVGDSVRGTLADLARHRLGRTDMVVTSPRFFREGLADDVKADPRFGASFRDAVPLIAMPGLVTAQASGRRAGRVLVYGVTDRFWQFHHQGAVSGPHDRDAFVSTALARETGLAIGDAALIRVEKPSAVPLESLHGRRDAIGRTIRLTVERVLDAEALGEFALSPTQGDVLAVFVPLARLQDELEAAGRVNTLLVSLARAGDRPPTGVLEVLVRDHARLEDVGLKLRALDKRHVVAVESEAGLLQPADVTAIEAAVDSTLLTSQPVFSYLANSIAVGSKTVPYSLVTAIDLGTVGVDGRGTAPGPAGSLAPIVLNQWAATELDARPGDTVRLEYYVWEDPGRLATHAAEFRLAAIVPVRPEDQDLAPRFQGITDSPTLESWNPPFPIDLSRVRPADEAYWKTFKTTPKAYVPLEVGQQRWGSRYGALTSVRLGALADRDLAETVQAFDERLRSKVDPFASGMTALDAGRRATQASSGTTDFGAYFLYFSFFIVVAALVLAALFFRLGVEQRAREVGLLVALGIDMRTVRAAFATEAAVIAAAGSAVGVLIAIAYTWLIVLGLGTWWIDAVGTKALTVHVSVRSLLTGAIGGLVAAVVCTIWTLRRLRAMSVRALMSGEVERGPDAMVPDAGGTHRRSHGAHLRHVRARLLWTSAGLALTSAMLIAAAALGAVDRAAAFFTAGAMLLGAALSAYAFLYRRPPRQIVPVRGWPSIARLGLRNAAFRPGRSVLSIGVIASATFIVIAVGAFRRHGTADAGPHSGVGGYRLLVESVLPVVHDIGVEEGRRELNLAGLAGIDVASFRLRPGDDASCLNLYAPQTPRILGAPHDFIAKGRFAFQSSIATTNLDRDNPWRLLETPAPADVVPVIADANSMTYVLHRAVGQDFVLKVGDRTVRLHFVAALADSIFQSEILMSDANFRLLFPGREGYQVWLVDAPADRAASLTGDLENALADYGADVTSTTERLAGFHRVENAYLSTFQMLGGLGLAIGTMGLAAVLLRNVLERRRELALLGALGYRRRDFVVMLVAESASWLIGGLAAGVVAAAIAVVPALMERGGRLPLTATAGLLVCAVLVAGVLSTIVAARLATRAPLLEALRSE